jgi:hypothetical protein
MHPLCLCLAEPFDAARRLAYIGGWAALPYPCHPPLHAHHAHQLSEQLAPQPLHNLRNHRLPH